MFFNYWVALNHELSYHLGDLGTFLLNCQETFYAVRDANVDNAKDGDNTRV